MSCRSILVIEDEQIIRENLVTILELEGYRVSSARNGEEGLQLLRTLEHPCLVLLDMLMPVMGGLEFLDEKNADDAIASIPVCIVSGVAEKETIAKAQAFVKKPIDFDCLLKFVREFCGK